MKAKQPENLVEKVLNMISIYMEEMYIMLTVYP